jgi:hypothetical protein
VRVHLRDVLDRKLKQEEAMASDKQASVSMQLTDQQGENWKERFQWQHHLHEIAGSRVFQLERLLADERVVHDKTREELDQLRCRNFDLERKRLALREAVIRFRRALAERHQKDAPSHKLSNGKCRTCRTFADLALTIDRGSFDSEKFTSVEIKPGAVPEKLMA